MVKHNDEEQILRRRKPITKEVLDRAIRAEENAVARLYGPADDQATFYGVPP